MIFVHDVIRIRLNSTYIKSSAFIFHAFKRLSFSLQKIAFCHARDNLLRTNRPPFGKPRFYRLLPFDSINVYLGWFRTLLPYSKSSKTLVDNQKQNRLFMLISVTLSG